MIDIRGAPFIVVSDTTVLRAPQVDTACKPDTRQWEPGREAALNCDRNHPIPQGQTFEILPEFPQQDPDITDTDFDTVMTNAIRW
jgi:hypothetical protein